MTHKDYFPLKLAKGDRFCNRIHEKEVLTANVRQARHTVMISPRRYGKSSLVHRVVNDLKLPCATIDLFLAHDDKAVTRRILEGVGSLLAQLMAPSQKAMAFFQKYFSNFTLQITAGGFALQSHYEATSIGAVEQIYEVLKALAAIAAKTAQKVIIFIDEFQDIQNAESARSIEGAIRNVAQDTDDVVFIFSGSNRHLLLQIFDDRSKPLYMLCDKINLDRMSSKDYLPYIQDAVKTEWGKPWDDATFRKVMVLTELHPFYVNLLCHALFQKKSFADEEAVMAAWKQCYQTEKRRIFAEVTPLPLNQKKLLKHLAVNPTTEPYSVHHTTGIGMSASSIKAGLDALLQKDLVFEVTFEDAQIPEFKIGELRVLDPLMAYALRQYF